MKRVIAYPHVHWDREWYKNFQEFRLRLVDVFDNILLALENSEIPCFYFDGQTAAIEDYLEIYPDKRLLLEKLISQKKLRVGPFYCLSDVFLVNSEALIRNLKIGINKSQELKETEFVAYLADTFGHSKGIINILNAFNINNIFLWRGLPDLPTEFRWQNLNAINLEQGYFQDVFSLKCSIDEKSQILKKTLDKIAKKSQNCIILPIGADHLNIPKNLKQQIEQVNKLLSDYVIELASPFEYLELVKDNYKIVYIEEFLDNSKTFVLAGVYSTRIKIKQENILSQWSLFRKAEPLQALLYFNGLSQKSMQAQCDYAAKELIKNHAHDSIYGCCIDSVNSEILQRFADVNTISHGITKKLTNSLVGNDHKNAIINLSNFEYNGSVEILTNKKLPEFLKAQKIGELYGFTDEKLYNIDEIPITEDFCKINKYLVDVKDIKPFCLDIIDDNKLCKQQTLEITNSSIGNKYIGLYLKDNKICIKDKINNIFYKDFFNIINLADIGDSYNFGALREDKKLLAKCIESKILQKGHIQSILRLTMILDIPKKSDKRGRSKKTLSHKFFVDVLLENQNEFLSFSIHWQNKSLNHILQAEFNLDNPITSVINEDTVGLLNRKFNPEYDVYNKIPAPKGIELSCNTAPFQRFIWAQNVGIMTKGLQEYQVKNNYLNITLQRSIGIISEPKNPTRGTPAGPPLPIHAAQLLGDNRAEFAIAFVTEPKKLYRYSEKYFYPCISCCASQTQELLFDIDNKNILVQAVKLDYEKNLIVRICNIDEKTQKLILKNKNYKFYLTSPLEEFLDNEVCELTILPNQILTVRILKNVKNF